MFHLADLQLTVCSFTSTDSTVSKEANWLCLNYLINVLKYIYRIENNNNMYLYILFSRRLVDYGNIAKANMTAFRWNGTRFYWETDTENFWFRIAHFLRSCELNFVNKSVRVLCKCKNSIIILFNRVHHDILFYPEAINISASTGVGVTKAQTCYSCKNGTVGMYVWKCRRN